MFILSSKNKKLKIHEKKKKNYFKQKNSEDTILAYLKKK